MVYLEPDTAELTLDAIDAIVARAALKVLGPARAPSAERITERTLPKPHKPTPKPPRAKGAKHGPARQDWTALLRGAAEGVQHKVLASHYGITAGRVGQIVNRARHEAEK